MRFFASHLHIESIRGHRKIEFVSASKGPEDLSSAIDIVDGAPWGKSGNFKSAMRVGGNPAQLDHPRTVFNRDNFMIPATHQTLEHESVAYFETPKPKGFRTIVPYDHHWISEVRIADTDYPRHPLLGSWIMRHPALSSRSARIGSGALSFQCPSTGYFGGDVDTILIRPKLYTPGAAEVFERVITSAGWISRLSDKGFYSRDAVGKLGGLKAAAAFLQDSKLSGFLMEFVKGKNHSAAGLFLSSDDRRYLNLPSAEALLGTRENSVATIDALVQQAVLYRGVILKCAFCRSANWFSVGEIDESFLCKRCRRRQTILSKHALGQDEPLWYYHLDEIVYQAILNHMEVPVLALNALAKKSSSFMYTDELEVRKADAEQPFIEIDLNCICDGQLTIGEAKSSTRIEGGGSREFRALKKYRDVATHIGATQFILATSETWSPETVSNALRVFTDSGVKVVALNGSDLVQKS